MSPNKENYHQINTEIGTHLDITIMEGRDIQKSDNEKMFKRTVYLADRHIELYVSKCIGHGFWGRCLNIRYVCTHLEPYFKVHSLVFVYPKNIKLGQKTTLNVIFQVVMSDYPLEKTLQKLVPVPHTLSEWPITPYTYQNTR